MKLLNVFLFALSRLNSSNLFMKNKIKAVQNSIKGIMYLLFIGILLLPTSHQAQAQTPNQDSFPNFHVRTVIQCNRLFIYRP